MMTPEQEDEIRSLIQGVEDRVRDTTDAVSIQTDALVAILETIAGELTDLNTEIKGLKECVRTEKQMKQ